MSETRIRRIRLVLPHSARNIAAPQARMIGEAIGAEIGKGKHVEGPIKLTRSGQDMATLAAQAACAVKGGRHGN